MLVLSRRVQEKIVIPCIGLTIQIVSVKPGVVRLAFDAPDDVKILREEVFDREVVREEAELVQTPVC